MNFQSFIEAIVDAKTYEEQERALLARLRFLIRYFPSQNSCEYRGGELYSIVEAINDALFVEQKLRLTLMKSQQSEKRKATKTIERWVNVYEEGVWMPVYSSREGADKDADYDRIACVKLTGTYEEDE